MKLPEEARRLLEQAVGEEVDHWTITLTGRSADDLGAAVTSLRNAAYQLRLIADALDQAADITERDGGA